jgi:hypothetical protein
VSEWQRFVEAAFRPRPFRIRTWLTYATPRSGVVTTLPIERRSPFMVYVFRSSPESVPVERAA